MGPGFCQGEAAASEAENCQHAEVNYLPVGPRAHLRVLEGFGFSIIKYAFCHILESPSCSFSLISDIQLNTKKVDINRSSTLFFNQFKIFLCYYTVLKYR